MYKYIYTIAFQKVYPLSIELAFRWHISYRYFIVYLLIIIHFFRPGQIIEHTDTSTGGQNQQKRKQCNRDRTKRKLHENPNNKMWTGRVGDSCLACDTRSDISGYWHNIPSTSGFFQTYLCSKTASITNENTLVLKSQFYWTRSTGRHLPLSGTCFDCNRKTTKIFLNIKNRNI